MHPRRLAAYGFSVVTEVAGAFGLKLRRDLGQHILVACFPKSGSTYLSEVLSRATGYEKQFFALFAGSNEQNLDPRVIRRLRFKNTVVQQHVKATENNLSLIDQYKMKVVVLTRNVADVVISIHDHVEREDHRTPLGYVHPEYFSMERSEKLTFIIRSFLPWYLSFLISWRDASQSRPCFWLTYEELFADPSFSVTRILEFCNISLSADHMMACVNSMTNASTRLNAGVRGRGAELTPADMDAVLDLARCWRVPPPIMRSIGLEV